MKETVRWKAARLLLEKESIRDSAIRITTIILLVASGYLGGSMIEARQIEQNINNQVQKFVHEIRPISHFRGNFGNSFLNLKKMKIDLIKKMGASRKVGGIYAHGNSLVGITRRGRFFYLMHDRSGPSFSTLDIGIDNNFEKFMKYAKRKKMNQFKMKMRFRYIDILFYEAHGRNYLIVSHHYWNDNEKCYTIQLSKLAVGRFEDLPALSAQAGDWTTLFESRPCLTFKSGTAGAPYPGHEHGGRMALAPDGSLLLTVGDFEYDGFNDPAIFAQDRNVDYGKILKIDPGTGARTIVSVGHRNAQGLMVDSKGNIWATEHGPQGGDELNLIVEGANYGWPYAANGTQYGRKTWPVALKQGRHDGFTAPIYSWLPAIAVSNLIEVHDFAPQWNGDFLVGSLKQNTLYRMRYDHGRIEFVEPIIAGERIRDIDQFKDGTIVLWTDSAKIIELRAGKAMNQPANAIRPIVLAGLDARLKNKARVVIRSCNTCHSTSPDGAGTGAPHLWGVYGRTIASTAYPHYSASLREKEGVWDEDALDAFLADPNGFAPDNRMAYSGVADPRMRRAVIEYLKTLDDDADH